MMCYVVYVHVMIVKGLELGGIPAVLLIDLDDTILAYEKTAKPIWREVCKMFIREFPGIALDKLVDAIDEYRKWFWSDPTRHKRARLEFNKQRNEVVEGGLKSLGIDDPYHAFMMGNEYAKKREQSVIPFPGAIDALVRLNRDGVRMAMVTNGTSETQRRKINRWDLEKHFDYILIEGEFGVGKPAAEVYIHAMDVLNAQPSETWMVGDNLEWEVAAPQRLGITGVWLDWRSDGLPSNTKVRPDLIITSLLDLI